MTLRKRGYLVEAIWTDIDGVSDVVDTSNPTSSDQYNLGNAGVLRSGKIIGWHITDSVKGVRQVVKKSGSIMKAYGKRGGTAELGPGLYISAVPQMWVNRSFGKWDFLKSLDIDKTKKLATSILKDISKMREQGRISDNEEKYAKRDIGHVIKGLIDTSFLVTYAGMPYGISFWKDSYLNSLGIDASTGPKIVEIHVTGKYAKIDSSHAGRSTLRTLRRGKFDGAFISGGFSGDPQLVVWNSKAIVKIGKEEAYSG